MLNPEQCQKICDKAAKDFETLKERGFDFEMFQDRLSEEAIHQSMLADFEVDPEKSDEYYGRSLYLWHVIDHYQSMISGYVKK